MLCILMAASYRGRQRGPLPRLFACALPVFGLLAGDPPADQIFVGFIADTECGPDHAPMRAKGNMGKNDKECTLKCVAKGATFQLDDQELPRPFAGEKVRIAGRIEGDTILVRSIARAGS